MRNIKKLVLGIGVGLLTMIAAIAFPPRGKTVWLRLSGAVMANDTRTECYADKPLRILSVTGQKWAGWDKLEAASAYHALIVLPQIVPNDSGSVSSSDGFIDTAIEKWQPWKDQSDNGPAEERELAVIYDAVWQTITVGSQTYHLAKGNLFVIRFDENWQPEVTQIEATISKDAGVEEVVRVFKSVLREDKMVQQL
jgi:hypothetical protein